MEKILYVAQTEVSVVAGIWSNNQYYKIYDEPVASPSQASPPKLTKQLVKQSTKQSTKKEKEHHYTQLLAKDKAEGPS